MYDSRYIVGSQISNTLDKETQTEVLDAVIERKFRTLKQKYICL